MKIGDLARRSGLSVDTIRYYERIGLLPRPDRDRSGHREYDASILVWIEFLDRLKTTGMPIREMLRYARLRAAGSGTEHARRELLEAHRDRARAHAAALNACLLVLDTKIGGYAEAEERMEPDDANQPQSERNPPGARPARAR